MQTQRRLSNKNKLFNNKKRNCALKKKTLTWRRAWANQIASRPFEAADQSKRWATSRIWCLGRLLSKLEIWAKIGVPRKRPRLYWMSGLHKRRRWFDCALHNDNRPRFCRRHFLYSGIVVCCCPTGWRLLSATMGQCSAISLRVQGFHRKRTQAEPRCPTWPTQSARCWGEKVRKGRSTLRLLAGKFRKNFGPNTRKYSGCDPGKYAQIPALDQVEWANSMPRSPLVAAAVVVLS